MSYVLVGGSNHDDGMYDGLWSIDYESGTAHLDESDEVSFLENSGYEVVRYKYDLESYLEEQGCKNIVESTQENLFTFE